jgi:hypothetical protein
MVQNIITYAIITASVAYMLLSLYRTVFSSKKKGPLHCAGCSSANPASPRILFFIYENVALYITFAFGTYA